VKLQSGSKMTDIISWDKAIDKKVKSSDDKDLGKIQSVTRDYNQTKEGTVDKKYYYIPKYYFQGYDGDHLWVSLRKDLKEKKHRKQQLLKPLIIWTGGRQ
jgi:hypothetical protein